MSDLSEIRPLSILSPSYLKSNLENKENIIMNNNINNINNIIENKSFQSKSQISSNLSMTHENNIFLAYLIENFEESYFCLSKNIKVKKLRQENFLIINKILSLEERNNKNLSKKKKKK
jgi:hypothetical protein